MARTQIDTSLIGAFSNTFTGVGRNRIINGEMRIDQANAGAATASIVNAIGYSVDQFWGIGENADGVFTLQRSTSTPPTGFTHFMRATCTTADASIGAGQRYYIANRLEGNNVRDFLLGTANAKQLTLSFWVRSSLTGTYSGSFRNDAGDRSYPFEYTVSVANTWEKKIITLTGDITGTWLTDTGNGFQVSWALAIGTTFQGTANAWGAASYFGTANQTNFMSSNTSRTWDITGVQLEIGSTPTPFEYKPYPIEFSLCKRYFWRFGGNVASEFLTTGMAFSTTQALLLFPHDGMRTTPTWTFTGGSGIRLTANNSSQVLTTANALNSGGPNSSIILSTVSSGLVAGDATNIWTNTTAAFIDASARL